MKRYSIRFKANKIGALGHGFLTDHYMRTIEAESPDKAVAELYREFEHVHMVECLKIPD